MADDRRRLPLDIAELLHDALCDCLDNGTGFTFRSADGQKAADALLPLLDRVAADAAAEALMTAFREDRTTVAHLGPVERLSCFLVKAEDLVARAAELRAPARTDEEN